MYDHAKACVATTRHLPSLEALLRLQKQVDAMIESLQEGTRPETRGWLSGPEVDGLVEQITTCLKSPTGFDLLWLLLPKLIEIVKEGEKAAAPP